MQLELDVRAENSLVVAVRVLDGRREGNIVRAVRKRESIGRIFGFGCGAELGVWTISTVDIARFGSLVEHFWPQATVGKLIIDSQNLRSDDIEMK